MPDPMDSQIFDIQKVFTSITLFTGKKFDNKVNVQNFKLQIREIQKKFKKVHAMTIILTFVILNNKSNTINLL